jgi:hypothetical protein
MQIDTEHLHHWMRAIRESKDPMRTMDAFWRGQIISKEWLIDELKKQKHHTKQWPSIDIHGGWVGTLASLLFQSDLYISHIRSIDIDPDCEDTARTMNQLEMEAGKFRAVTADMCTIRSDADIVINTSFEHISQDDYDLWLSGMRHDSLIVLQSNNYSIPEHVRIARDLEEFKFQTGLKNILFAGKLELPLYTRFMIIGKQYV